jgi:hypothetical protein
MELLVEIKGNYTQLIVAKDGNPVSPQNPIKPSELKNIFDGLELSGGEMVVVSGMPTYAISAVTAKVKNMFAVIGVYDPKLQGAVIVHSITSDFNLGDIIHI